MRDASSSIRQSSSKRSIDGLLNQIPSPCLKIDDVFPFLHMMDRIVIVVAISEMSAPDLSFKEGAEDV